MSNHRTSHMGLGTALLTALICVIGSACVEAPAPSVGEEAIGEAGQADVVAFPPRTTFSCTMPGDAPGGRRWATLIVADDRKVCYKSRDFVRLDPVESGAMSCDEFGRTIGCVVVVEI
ncbi:hypothetical protein [Sorangium sp. So ce1078]|uniref:hypothetical protein n=1 Tax=Sorangium sp. So ce1078 TaxID=3133329 RepID=UPI003F606895